MYIKKPNTSGNFSNSYHRKGIKIHLKCTQLSQYIYKTKLDRTYRFMHAWLCIQVELFLLDFLLFNSIIKIDVYVQNVNFFLMIHITTLPYRVYSQNSLNSVNSS